MAAGRAGGGAGEVRRHLHLSALRAERNRRGRLAQAEALSDEAALSATQSGPRLLPRPGGLEGLGMALVSATPDGEATAEADYPADFAIEGDAAPEPGAKVTERQNDVALVSNLVDARLKLLEGGVQVRPPRPDPFVSAVGHVALDLRREGVPLDLGVRDFQERLDVVPKEGLHALAEELHVLLRHPRAVSRHRRWKSRQRPKLLRCGILTR